MQATVDEQYMESIYDDLLGYRDDPIGFMVNVLDVKPEHVWPKMREVAESVCNHQFTAVPAGHGVSKTYTAARIALWFKACFQPSTVITTAPSKQQVRGQLWREVHAGYAGAKVKLGGKMTTLEWNVKPSEEILAKLDQAERGQWEKNFAVGFSTSPDTVAEHCTKMHGWHNKWLLVILDEFGGLIPQIFRTVMQSLITNERCKVLGIGNPVDPYSDFAEVCEPDSGWNVIPISVRDTPNYIEDREVVPEISGRSQEAPIIKKYGENSNEHKVRCLGQFPDYAEGSFYGAKIAEVEKRNHYGDFPWDETAMVYTFGDYGDIYNAVLFVQFIGPTIRIIDYFYDDTGIGVSGICKVFDIRPYLYAKSQGHWGGPDMDPQHGSNRKSQGSGRTIISEFGNRGYLMNVCTKHSFDDGIEDGRALFQLVRVSTRCADFWDQLKKYKKKKNLQYSTDDKPAYHKDPEPTPACHPADAYRHLARVYRHQLIIDGRRIGFTAATSFDQAPRRSDNPYGSWKPGQGRRTG